MFEIGYEKNAIVTHDELCKKIGCGCMGGIRCSKRNNVLVLFINQNSKYNNIWVGDTLKYMGSGKGNQSIERGGNKQLAQSNEKDVCVLLFEWVDSINCKYIGPMVLVDEPYYENIKNKYGEKERKVFFNLRIKQ